MKKLTIVLAPVVALCFAATSATAQTLKGPTSDKPLTENWAPSKWGVDSEFVGGCDIVREMYESGELQRLLDKQTA